MREDETEPTPYCLESKWKETKTKKYLIMYIHRIIIFILNSDKDKQLL